jgi:hypothetical protein
MGTGVQLFALTFCRWAMLTGKHFDKFMWHYVVLLWTNVGTRTQGRQQAPKIIFFRTQEFGKA